MDDTARELLGTTCTHHNQIKCMRVPLAENVPKAPTNVGRTHRVASATVLKAGAPRATVRQAPAREAREGRG